MKSIVILAGGEGTRLGRLTADTPKPMVDVFGKPFLHWLIKDYIRQGFTDITISTGYKFLTIETYNWEWPLEFHRDTYENSYLEFFDVEYNTMRWVANGDTFILGDLIQTDRPTIVTCNDVDAGAQYVAFGKIQTQKVPHFFDIGTLDGLGSFKRYFMTHLQTK